MTFEMLQNTLKSLYFRLKYTLHLENQNNVENLDKNGNTNVGYDLPEPQDRIASQLKPVINILYYLGGYPIVEKSKQNLISRQSIGPGYTKNRNDITGSLPWKLFQLSDYSIFEKLENIKVNKLDLLEADFVNEDDIGKYELTYTKWTSPKTWYSYFVKLVTFLSVFVFLFNVALDIPFPLRMFSVIQSTSEFSRDVKQNIHKATMSTTAILKLVEMTVLFGNSGGFVDWINTWSVFEMDFWKSFGLGKSGNNPCFKFDISRFRNVVIGIYLVIPMMIWGCCILSMFTMYDFQYEYLSRIILLLACQGVWGQPLLEDTKIIILFRTSVLALRQIRLGIKEESLASPKFRLTPDDIIGWRNLITSARAQTALACNYLKNQQIIFIAETIILCSLGLGFIATVIGESALFTKVPLPLFVGTGYYCISSVLRLYVKVILAEQIPAEELLIAGDVVEVDSVCNEASTKAELKFLHNMLTEQTVQVNMGNYFKMNKQLILQVGVQVVTYLIVIMQFKGAAGQ